MEASSGGLEEDVAGAGLIELEEVDLLVEGGLGTGGAEAGWAVGGAGGRLGGGAGGWSEGGAGGWLGGGTGGWLGGGVS